MNRAKLEIEAKFVVPSPSVFRRLPGALAALAHTVEPARTGTATDRYLDTDDFWFWRAGAACRLRLRPDGAELALKTLAPARDGLASRTELTELLAEPPAGLPGPVPGRRIAKWVAPLMDNAPVRLLFELEQSRTTYVVQTRGGGARLQVSADDIVRVNAQPTPDWLELEIELLDGDPLELQAFARSLRARLRLRPGEQSKFAQGLALAGITPPTLAQDGALIARADDRFIDVAHRVFQRHVQRLCWHEPGTRLGLDPEPVHDMRVAARRLRAALRVFGDALPAREAGRLRRDLKWIADALGHVRDLDVYLETVRDDMRHLPVELHDELNDYRKCQQSDRVRAREAMLRVLRSRRFERFMAHYAAFFKTGAPVGCRSKLGRTPVTRVAPEMVDTALRKVLKDGRRIRGTSPDLELHTLRIRCKRLRYLGEFLQDIYGPPVARFARRVAELQDVLGAHQDAIVAQRMIQAFVDGRQPAKPSSEKQYFALGQLTGWKRAQAAQSRLAFAAAWRAFDRKKTRRALLKRLQALQRKAAAKRRRSTRRARR